MRPVLGHGPGFATEVGNQCLQAFIPANEPAQLTPEPCQLKAPRVARGLLGNE